MAKAKAFKPPRTRGGPARLPGLLAQPQQRHRLRRRARARQLRGAAHRSARSSIPPTRRFPISRGRWRSATRLRTKGFEDPQGHCAPSGAPRKNNTLFGWRIIQPKGYVTFLYESMHDYRIIPTDGRKHLPASIKMWHGDPVGPLGGRHAGGGLHQPERQALVRHVGQLPEREHPRGRALHDVHARHDPVRRHDRGLDDVHAAVDARLLARAQQGTRATTSSNTPATKASATCSTSPTTQGRSSRQAVGQVTAGHGLA